MRWAVLPLLLAGCAQSPAGGGGGIVSTNPCADAILVQLVAPDRIAAISHYSQEASATSIPLSVANRFRATAGTAEEVIALKPDLVLTSSFTPLATREAYARAGLQVLLLDSPVTVAASEAQVMQVATAVGAEERGRAIVGKIDASVVPPRMRGASPRQEKSAPPPSRGNSALLYIAGDLATGSGTLLDDLLTRAGFTNAAARYGLKSTNTLPAETIVTHPPDIIIAPDKPGRTAAIRRRLLPQTPEAIFPRTLVNCGGPSIPPAMARLRAIRTGLR